MLNTKVRQVGGLFGLTRTGVLGGEGMGNSFDSFVTGGGRGALVLAMHVVTVMAEVKRGRTSSSSSEDQEVVGRGW